MFGIIGDPKELYYQRALLQKYYKKIKKTQKLWLK